MLLGIPAVYELAEANNFYQAEIRNGIDLRALARDRESSMNALSLGEQKRLEGICAHYKEGLTKEKIPGVIEELRARLIDRYNKKPACIQRQGQDLALPLTWQEFKGLQLTPEERKSAFEAYYKHKDHTALRYLSAPNLWMHPDAAYVIEDERTRQRRSTFIENQTLIALFYLAAKDERIAATEGHSPC